MPFLPLVFLLVASQAGAVEEQEASPASHWRVRVHAGGIYGPTGLRYTGELYHWGYEYIYETSCGSSSQGLLSGTGAALGATLSRALWSWLNIEAGAQLQSGRYHIREFHVYRSGGGKKYWDSEGRFWRGTYHLGVGMEPETGSPYRPALSVGLAYWSRVDAEDIHSEPCCSTSPYWLLSLVLRPGIWLSLASWLDLGIELPIHFVLHYEGAPRTWDSEQRVGLPGLPDDEAWALGLQAGLQLRLP